MIQKIKKGKFLRFSFDGIRIIIKHQNNAFFEILFFWTIVYIILKITYSIT